MYRKRRENKRLDTPGSKRYNIISRRYKMSENNMVVYEKLGLANDFMFGKIMQRKELCKPFVNYHL